MVSPIRIAVVGLGKIARDQHLPAIAGDPAFELAATVNPHGEGLEGVPHFHSLDALLDGPHQIDAVALCTPPQSRYALAALAADRGLHLFLEKPPGATLAEVAALRARAPAGVSLFAAWHSRFAAGVEPARAWLAGRDLRKVTIVWREDVRVWHPGQDWIWQAGGLGVFDPGINALSIATRILPRPLILTEAALTFPSNRDAPIAADLALTDTQGVPVSMDLDFRQTGPQSWDIVVETNDGRLTLSKGGAVLEINGVVHQDEDREYAGLYARFADLISAGESEVDITPAVLVADAFLRGRRLTTEPFHE